MIYDFRLGISKEFSCNYLPGNQERLLIVVDELHAQANQYDYLMHQGFRRSGEQVYRPHCKACHACQSVKVMVQEFTPSKSQKRSLKKNQHLRLVKSRTPSEQYYPLFERYINELHADGAMYPASAEQYQSFLFTHICKQYFVELYDGDKLVSVAVTDELPSALSAVYTFYDPDYRKNGLGIYSILKQIHVAQSLGKEFLYLGYQIDDCQKMNYKTKFYPHQRLYNNQWHIVPSPSYSR
ncbi:arginyltransferase [Thalassotalea euphylliae]|uniref:Aspartate/glutamate leucyltransferase n=1 Tax=Thalassotalea euphylliae TaxID=1655234 RepID=A0A3E0UFX2_9GAMM|nr:arginyltransferase [Thalassotalea euphylliae]REL35503.1 arginyltransferase [Thalassotalea euphylliae]